MIKLTLILLLLALSIWLGIQLHGDPGYILIVFRHWSLESTLWVGLFAIFILFFTLYILLQTYQKTAHFPKYWHHWHLKHRTERAQKKTTQGLIEFSEGYWKAAKTHLIQALPYTETPLINYLIAARAAQELNDTKLRDNFLREAQQSMPNAKIAVELTQAQLQLAHHQWEQALATLRHLHDLAPKHPYVLKRLAHLYEVIEDWPNLISLLPSLIKNHALPEKNLSELTYRAYLGDIKQLIKQEAWEVLDTRVTALPRALKYNAVIINHYAQALIKQQEAVQAERHLRRVLQKNTDCLNQTLIETYSTLPANAARIAFLESCLKSNAHSAALHLCLGKLYMTNQLFGKAQTHLEQSIKIKPTSETYYALGQLFETLKEASNAFDAYKQGLALARNA